MRGCQEDWRGIGGDSIVCSKSGSSPSSASWSTNQTFLQNLLAAQTARIHLVSLPCSVLCGVDAPIDTGDGAGMNLLNIQNWDWDTDLLEATAPELIKRLPKVA